MDIVIKSFKRPFYIERLLESIRRYCLGYNRILIADGGTDKLYENIIMEKFPEVEWFESPSAGKRIISKNYLNKNDVSSISLDDDRLNFWRSVIEKSDSKFILLIEDDCWLTEELNLRSFEEILIQRDASFCKLWFSEVPQQRFSSQSKLLDHHEINNKLSILEYKPNLSRIDSLYNYFIMAQAIFSKEYYLAATKNCYVEDETEQILKAYEFLKNKEGSSNPRAFQSSLRIIYQGWAVSVRSDDVFLLRAGFSGFNLIDVLSKQWSEGLFNCSENTPFDFSKKFILECLKNGDVSSDILNAYSLWRNGCTINPNNMLI
jgi:hypothetical protein